MYPVLFHIGKIIFYSHGVLMVAGIVLGALLVYLLARKSELDSTYFLDNVIYTSLFGIIGARIAYFIIYPHQYTNVSQIFLLWQGGLVSFGGFIAGAITLLVVLRAEKQPILPWFDHFAIGLPLGIGIGRVGDWMANDYGILPQTMITTVGGLGNNPLLETGLCGLILTLLLLIFFFLKSRIADGNLFYMSILIYSGGRFIIDFWRRDPHFLMSLSLGQVFSLIVFLATATAIIITMKRRKGVYNGII